MSSIFHVLLVLTFTDNWAVGFSPECGAGECAAGDQASLLQDRVGLAGIHVTPAPQKASQSRDSGTGVVLHMHFGERQWMHNIKFYLEETKMCDPDNFVACLFVSDWTTHLDLPELNGRDVRFIDCPINSQRRLPSTGEVWSAFYMHMCLVKSLKVAKGIAGAEGVLFLADDAVIVRPWKPLAAALKNHGGIVVPGIDDPSVKQDTNLLDERTWPPHENDVWFWDGDSPPKANPQQLLRAVRSLEPAEQVKLGVTNESVPVFKSSGDVVYVPLSRADDFERLTNVFHSYGVFAEYAIGNIARAIEGEHALPTASEKMSLMSLWGKDRADPFGEAFMLRLGSLLQLHESQQEERSAFMHPVKLGGKSVTKQEPSKNKIRLKFLYENIFASSQAHVGHPLAFFAMAFVIIFGAAAS